MLLGWWGIVSLAAGTLALAFLPAAIMDRADGTWIDKLWNLSFLWASCCLIGLITGIRGCQFQKKATNVQRTTAFAGTLLSLFVFMAFTVIVTVMSG